MDHFRELGSFVQSSDCDQGDVEKIRSEHRQELARAKLQLLIIKVRQSVQGRDLSLPSRSIRYLIHRLNGSCTNIN
jgi:hypothetical protein